jgi:hypothetical protein
MSPRPIETETLVRDLAREWVELGAVLDDHLKDPKGYENDLRGLASPRNRAYDAVDTLRDQLWDMIWTLMPDRARRDMILEDALRDHEQRIAS